MTFRAESEEELKNLLINVKESMTCVYGGLKYTSNETEICLRPTNILVTIQLGGSLVAQQ